MEHEVFVPVPAEVLRATLTDPARVVRCVPGFQRDADAEAGPLAGRLKVRVGGNTITYRGALKVVERDGAVTYEGQGTEARGKGTAELSLTVVLTPVAEGTSLSFTGGLTAAGRLAEATEEARATAGARLLDKFVEALAALAEEPEPEPEPAELDTADDTEDTDDDGVDDGVEEPRRESVFDAPVPPPSLDPLLAEELADTPIEFPAPQPAAEAAHARRTMIGRSAEEVDHAPPRGRYAPVPAPESTSAGATLRWIAPAAALALASAVVVGRALRRRR
ncbi:MULTISPECIES: SRPBCC family protein [Streptomyces]|uniref:Putative membrane protein n=1 Tax=Streptomyces venezuelae (strain ATCC 10712 / CBS 650.69 / DSM 40230 / JCM 4526 / NBRC 13096 / PD 04745) TaxID=953739 RepID=F2RBJ2_STRVP|nr:SRPBCC family protein [Streptomyces venezuelae]APE22513.1 carbon monoxide dehydrogenase [Streptomyces venezuelae]QER99894.1 carbon monoxide dehydrogenase [Streptomyces venezuelae ATCC 10712]CCA56703.1 putative membrane protein [Streptomyces venezuelae ATCC 10712]